MLISVLLVYYFLVEESTIQRSLLIKKMCIGRVCTVRVLCVVAGLAGPVRINMENACGDDRVKNKGDT